MEWPNKNILITGANGFIGSHLARRLKEGGANVVRLDTYPYSYTENLWSLDLLRLNEPDSPYGSLEIHGNRVVAIKPGLCLKRDLVNKLYGIDIVYHLAAQSHVPDAEKDANTTWLINCFATINLVRASIIAGVDQFIYAGSDKEYGDSEYIPIDEKHPLNGRGVYARTKINADKRLQKIAGMSSYDQFWFAISTSNEDELTYLRNREEVPHDLRLYSSDNIRWVGDLEEIANKRQRTKFLLPRFSNIYGPDQDFRKLVPSVIKTISEGHAPWYNECIRDFLYIDDAINAYIRIPEEAEQLNGVPINFSTGRGTTIYDVERLIIEYMGKNIEPVASMQRADEIKKQIVSYEKAKQLLGWEPKVPLEDGLRHTVEWYRLQYQL